MPRYRRILLVVLTLGVVAAVFHERITEFFENLRPAVSRVVLVDAEGNSIPMRGRVDLFPLDRSLFMQSPLPRLRSIEFDETRPELVLDDASYPKSVQVCFHVPGYGVDYTSVDIGKRHTFRLRLGRPRELKGIVTSVTGEPMPGARVLALGGSDRGVVLEETTTRSDGTFTLADISEYVPYVKLRILKDGFSLQEREYHWGSRDSEERRSDFRIVPVPPVQGQVRLPDGLRAGALCVTVLNYAGAVATVGADGRFALRHLAVGGRYRLLLQGLPGGFTHREAYAQPGERVTIEVVASVTLRGEVVSERLGHGIAKAKVWHTHTTRGKESCVTDGYGRFELRDVPLGGVRITVLPPEAYFGGEATDKTIAVASQHAKEPVAIHIH